MFLRFLQRASWLAPAVLVTALSGCVVVVDDLRPYDDCTGGARCGYSTSCTSIQNQLAVRDMCTNTCIDSFDCATDRYGYAGECIAFPASPSVCFQSCNFSSECEPGWSCESFFQGVNLGFGICVPSAK